MAAVPSWSDTLHLSCSRPRSRSVAVVGFTSSPSPDLCPRWGVARPGDTQTAGQCSTRDLTAQQIAPQVGNHSEDSHTIHRSTSQSKTA
ncbi:hypothetical protein RRG08_015624 [Elysia crispata]|uniref:Uncharacterized protein n=1 Tax=Elysia crispata TaxID=231223 RepID=A0AAE0Y797_9GAST|nr:hypothetical protein RRG08_015624 [Elysia crispata]